MVAAMTSVVMHDYHPQDFFIFPHGDSRLYWFMVPLQLYQQQQQQTQQQTTTTTTTITESKHRKLTKLRYQDRELRSGITIGN